MEERKNMPPKYECTGVKGDLGMYASIEDWRKAEGSNKYDSPLLNEREKTHGDYAQVAACSQALKVALREYGTLLKPAEVNESLELICMKMARIVCGDFSHRDSWDDIIGYAELARKAVCGDGLDAPQK